MHIKKRTGRAMLYRSLWVRKGAEGNSHGFARQQYIGSLCSTATAVPAGLAAKLTAAELDLVERQVVRPARDAAARADAEVQRRVSDPLWRLEEGLRLLREAAELSERTAVPVARVRELQAALGAVRVVGSSPRPAESDPLEAALDALRNAARAVAAGHYGRAPEEGVRKSAVYARWLEICGQIEGSAPDGLLRQLQAASWVKAKGR